MDNTVPTPAADPNQQFIDQRATEDSVEARADKIKSLYAQEQAKLGSAGDQLKSIDDQTAADAARENEAASNGRPFFSLKDLGWQAVGGIRDFAENTWDSLARGTIRNMAENIDAATGGEIPKLSEGQVNQLVAYGDTQIPHLPTVHDADSTVGRFERPVVQFLTGFIPIARAARAAGASKAVQVFGSGAIVDAYGFDPKSGGLSNIIQEHPALANPVTKFLATDPNDSDGENRLKHALEGSMSSLALDGLFHALSAIRASKFTRAANQAAKDPVDFLHEPPAPEAAPEAPKAPPEPAPAAEPAPAEGAPAPAAETPDSTVIGEGVDLKHRFRGFTSPFTVEPGKVDEFMDLLNKGDVNNADTLVQYNKDLIDWSKIESPDDVKAVLDATSQSFEDLFTKARGGVDGVQNWALTQRLSNLVGTSYENVNKLFIDTRAEHGLTARMHAAEKTMIASAQRLRDLAKTAASPQGTAEDLIAARSQAERHALIMSEVVGSKAEVARALQGMKKLKAASSNQYRDFNDIVRQIGGVDGNKQWLDRVLNSRGPVEIGKVVRKSSGERFLDALREYYYSNLLSSPLTHATNAVDNALKVVSESALMRPTAYLIGRARRAIGQDVSTIRAGEIGEAGLYAVQRSLHDTLRLPGAAARAAGKAAKDSLGKWDAEAFRSEIEKSDIGTAYKSLLLDEPILDTSQKLEYGTYRAISADPVKVQLALNNLANKYGIPGPALDAMQAGGKHFALGVNLMGAAIRSPSRLLLASDEVFKGIAYRQELHAQSYRQAARGAEEQGLTGEARAKFIRSNIDKTTKNVDAQLHLDSLDYARRQTYTEPLTGSWAYGQRFFNSVPGGWLILPFYKVGTNILKQTINHTPLKLMQLSFLKQIKQGGPQADLAMARVAVGTMAMTSAYHLVTSGVLTGGGPKDKKAWAADGRMPYSVKIGDQWYSYNRFSVLGGTLGLAADASEIVNNIDQNGGQDNDGSQAITAVTLAMAKNAASKTWMKGLSDFVEMVDDPDRFGKQWVYNQGASLVVPFGGLLKTADHADDSTTREAFTFLETLKSRIPGLSDSLPPKRDILGRVVPYKAGLGPDWLSPIAISPASKDPVDQELSKLTFTLQMPPKNLDGVPLTAQQYSRLNELTGQPSPTAKSLHDSLADVMSSSDWKNLSNRQGEFQGSKEDIVKQIIGGYRASAVGMLLAEDKTLRDQVVARRVQAANVLAGQQPKQ